MTRVEQLRAYWEARIPACDSLYLSDAARWINRGMDRPVVSLRTLQRRAGDGSLRAYGGPDRALRQYRVLRQDLIEFLCSLDVISGHEPPEPKPLPKRERKRLRKQQRKAAAAERAARPQQAWFGEQRGLFDTD